MEQENIKLDSLRRIAKRLREIKDDNFAEGLASRLEAEVTRHHEGAGTTASGAEAAIIDDPPTESPPR